MTLIVQHQKTMSSVELVEVINSLRTEGQAELRHDNFMTKVEKVLGIDAPKFLGTQKYGNNLTRAVYDLPKREAALMVMSESYAVQAKVYDRMTELEGAAIAAPTAAPALRLPSPAKELRAALSIAKMLGLSGNQAIISANRAVTNVTGIDLMVTLGATHLPTPTQEICFTPTELGHRRCISARTFNKSLVDAGLQTSVSGHWVPTEKGLPHAVVLDTGKSHGNGTPIQQVKWLDSVMSEVAL